MLVHDILLSFVFLILLCFAILVNFSIGLLFPFSRRLEMIHLFSIPFLNTWLKLFIQHVYSNNTYAYRFCRYMCFLLHLTSQMFWTTTLVSPFKPNFTFSCFDGSLLLCLYQFFSSLDLLVINNILHLAYTCQYFLFFQKWNAETFSYFSEDIYCSLIYMNELGNFTYRKPRGICLTTVLLLK